jgi:hypothetical protein
MVREAIGTVLVHLERAVRRIWPVMIHPMFQVATVDFQAGLNEPGFFACSRYWEREFAEAV